MAGNNDPGRHHLRPGKSRVRPYTTAWNAVLAMAAWRSTPSRRPPAPRQPRRHPGRPAPPRDDPALAASLDQFTGHPAYGITQLRQDLERFVFLLGGSDGDKPWLPRPFWHERGTTAGGHGLGQLVWDLDRNILGLIRWAALAICSGVAVRRA